MPVHSCRLLADRSHALALPRADVRLAFCDGCGFIQNAAYDPSLQNYAESYEDTQAGSPRFDDFAAEVTSRLVEGYGIRGKTILEIGCGRGDFLVRLCAAGDNRGIGFDPAFRPSEVSERAGTRVRFVPELFAEGSGHHEADLVFCRHTLEHLPTPREFLAMLRRTLGDRHRTLVYLEVPDVSRILREQAFWDVYYEHCSYFSAGSLARLCRGTGFGILDLQLGFGDQYLMIEARPDAVSPGRRLPREDDLEPLRSDVARFEERAPERLAALRARLDAWREAGKRVALWGSGSKAAGYLTTLGVGEEVGCVVDINPRKHGMFQAGTGHPIVAPEYLREFRPHLVIPMNPIYAQEIRADLDNMGIDADLELL